MCHSIIHFISRNSKKVFECIQQDFNIGELLQKEIIRFENATFRYSFSRGARLRIEIEDSDSLQVSVFMVLG